MARHELGAAERRARMVGWRSGDVLRATALVTSYLLALALAWTAREIVLTAFLGVSFGLAVGAGADQLTTLRIPRGLGAPRLGPPSRGPRRRHGPAPRPPHPAPAAVARPGPAGRLRRRARPGLTGGR